MTENIYKKDKNEGSGTEDIITIGDDLYDELEDEILGYRTVDRSAAQQAPSVSEDRHGKIRQEFSGNREKEKSRSLGMREKGRKQCKD